MESSYKVWPAGNLRGCPNIQQVPWRSWKHFSLLILTLFLWVLMKRLMSMEKWRSHFLLTTDLFLWDVKDATSLLEKKRGRRPRWGGQPLWGGGGIGKQWHPLHGTWVPLKEIFTGQARKTQNSQISLPVASARWRFFSFWCKVHCLHTESGTHGIPNEFLFEFMFRSVYYCKVLSCMNEQPFQMLLVKNIFCT